MKQSIHAKQQGISYQSASRIWHRGELPAHQLPTGAVLLDVLPTSPTARHLLLEVYAPVSSAGSRNILKSHAERVAAFCAPSGWQAAKVVKECGSANHDQRPQLHALLPNTSFCHIVVKHMEGCSCSGVPHIQTRLKAQGRDLVVIDAAEEFQDDLLQDLAAISTSFCAQLYGRQRASRKNPQLVAALEVPGCA